MDLRKILSENIRCERKAQHLTQSKLAEKAGISFPYMTDIEQCKTWVSDKTLAALAKALHISPFELLMPPKAGDGDNTGKNTEQGEKTRQANAQHYAELSQIINSRRAELVKAAEASIDESMDGLLESLLDV
ncbi:MAG: helix-turn-helix domain-containing protein [Spirochaetaceae bacterium]|nr:helix-turn-helix domain-containing protein [Spirochaetaceae bacterium]